MLVFTLSDALAIAVALVVLVTMSFGPGNKSWLVSALIFGCAIVIALG